MERVAEPSEPSTPVCAHDDGIVGAVGGSCHGAEHAVPPVCQHDRERCTEKEEGTKERRQEEQEELPGQRLKRRRHRAPLYVTARDIRVYICDEIHAQQLYHHLATIWCYRPTIYA